MVQYFGDFPEDHAAVRIPFNTFTSNDPSASATISNLADADIKVHKDGGLTQLGTDGATVVIDFDSITGNHVVTIDTSAHSDYSVGSEYQVRIEGTTVDSGTINAWIGCFSIERAGGALALLKGATGLAAIDTVVDSILADTNELQTDNVPGLIATLDAVVDTVKAETALIVADTNELQSDNVPGLIAALDAVVDTVKAETVLILADTADIQPNYATAAALATVDTVVDAILVDTGTTLQAELDAIQAAVITNATGADIAADIIALKAETALIVADTNELQADNVPGLISTLDAVVDTVKVDTAAILLDTAQIGVAGAGLTALATQTSVNTVDANVDAVLVDTGTTLPATLATIDGIVDSILVDTAEIGTAGAGLTNLGASANNWNVGKTGYTLTATTGLGAQTANLTGNVSGSVGSVTGAVGSVTGAVTISAGSVDLIWDENIIAAHTTANTAGKKLADAGGAADPWATTLPGSYGAGTAGEIVGDWKEAGRLDALLDSVKAETALIIADTNELQTDDVPGLIATLDAVVDTVKAETVLILADTADIQPNYATAAALATVDTVVDGIQTDLSNATDGLGAIKAETALIVADTNELQADDVPTLISTLDAVVDTVKSETALILADTNELQGDWVDGGRLDVILDAATAPTAAAVADAVWDEALAGHVGAGSYGKAVADIETDATAILADTNELQTDDIPGLITTLDAVVDTVKADTAAILIDTNELQGDDVPGLIATLDAVVDTVKAETALILTDTGTTIPGTITTAQADLTQLQEGIIYGACGSASLTTTTCSTNLSGYTADQLIGRVIIFTALSDGPATGEATDITDYVVTNGVLTFTALTVAPENTNSFKIV